MRAYRCDRCSAFYDPYEKKKGEFSVLKGGIKCLDLCPKCQETINECMTIYDKVDREIDDGK